MTRRRQTSQPVPVTPTHRPDWRTLWRRCSCGLTCPCVDRAVPAKPRPFPPSTATTFLSPTSREDRCPIPPALVDYLATVPFPIPGGYTALRPIPSPRRPSPPPTLPTWAVRRSPPTWPPQPTPKPQFPGASAAHPSGPGAKGGPGESPCPGSRTGAAPISPPRPALPHPPAPAPSAQATANAAAAHAPSARATASAAAHAPSAHATASAPASAEARTADAGRRPRTSSVATCSPAKGAGGSKGIAINTEAGERAGRASALGSRTGPDGGRRGRPPAFGGRPAMAYHHINLSRR